jgi:hypothetical protein
MFPFCTILSLVHKEGMHIWKYHNETSLYDEYMLTRKSKNDLTFYQNVRSCAEPIAIILPTQQAEIRIVWFKGSQGKKLVRPHLNQ